MQCMANMVIQEVSEIMNSNESSQTKLPKRPAAPKTSKYQSVNQKSKNRNTEAVVESKLKVQNMASTLDNILNLGVKEREQIIKQTY